MKKINSKWEPSIRSKSWSIRAPILLILSLLIFVFCVSVSVYVIIVDGSGVVVLCAILIFVFCTTFFLYCCFWYVIEKRRFQMSKEGISILYCGCIEKFYPWNVFKKIVVCDFDHASGYPPNCRIIIRLSSFDESYGPHSKKQKYRLCGVESWRGYHYTVRNFNKILFMEYSPELLDEISKLSNLGVMFSLTQYGRSLMEDRGRFCVNPNEK